MPSSSKVLCAAFSRPQRPHCSNTVGVAKYTNESTVPVLRPLDAVAHHYRPHSETGRSHATAASATAMSDEAGPPTNTHQTGRLQQGVRKCITKEGTNPKIYGAGMEVVVHYTGTLPGSTEPFDCSRKRGQPFTCLSWAPGVSSRAGTPRSRKSQLGNELLLEIESEWAYGKEGHPPTIPPDSTLHLDVELLSVGEKKKELNMMTAEEKLAEATEAEAEGPRCLSTEGLGRGS